MSLLFSLVTLGTFFGSASAVPIPGCDLRVSVQACDDFIYFGSRNSLTIQIQGENSESEWLIVNEQDSLPDKGATKEYCIDFSDIGNFLWANIQIIEEEDFCITNLELEYSNTVHTFDDSYFGSGIFLSNDCEYSYKWLNDDTPLLPCHDTSFKLNTFETRTIYNFDFHTCLRKESTTSVKELKEDITFNLLVKDFEDTEWRDVPQVRLDHFLPSVSSESFNGKRLGTLVAVDYNIESSPRDNDFIVKRSGVVIGMRVVFKDDGVFQLGRWNNQAHIIKNEGEKSLYIRLTDTNIVGTFVWSNLICLEEINDRCVDVLFFTAHQKFKNVVEGSRLNVGGVIAGSGTNPTFPTNVDIFLLYNGNEDIYQIPYVREVLTSGQRRFFDADKKCLSTYGTHSASIHNELSNNLAKIFCQWDENCWTGAYQFSKNGLDDGFWKWTDNTGIFTTNEYSSFWHTNEPNDHDDKEDCVALYGSESALHKWNDFSCMLNGLPAVICNSPYWYSDQNRKFQFNFEESFDEVIMMGISNSGDNPFCIDSINGKRLLNDHNDNLISKQIGPTNWVGQKNGENICSTIDCSSSIYAFFSLPVCEINIISTTLDLSFPSETNIEESTVTGLTCQNNNRFISSTCTVSQNIEVTEESSIELSHTRGSSKESSFTAGRDTTVNVGNPTLSNFPLMEQSSSFERSSTKTNFNEQTTSDTFTSSRTNSVDCAGEIEVPPSHKIDYLLTISQETLSVKTLNTLELVLCSAFVQDDESSTNDNALSEEAGNVVYEYNVPGKVVDVTASVCTVIFDTAERLTSVPLTCDEMNALAVRTGATYMPLCNKDNVKLYDGCQCETGDSLTSAPCYCVNKNSGSIIGGTAIFSEDADWRDTCRQLQCPDSQFTTSI